MGASATDMTYSNSSTEPTNATHTGGQRLLKDMATMSLLPASLRVEVTVSSKLNLRPYMCVYLYIYIYIYMFIYSTNTYMS